MRMGWQIWVIIGLLALSYYQYTSPDKANEMLKPYWGAVQDFIGTKNPLNNNSSDNGLCPDTVNKVCGSDGVTYQNTCLAAQNGITEVTPGEC